jgi:hypothetical protein
MASHRGVDNYWGAYQNRLDDVERLHRPHFGLHRLRLEADEEWHDLQTYLDSLIDGAAPDTAVLQFNRVDFRLPWLKARFPQAKIIHLFRDCRDSWFSMTRQLTPAEADDPARGHVYDLLEWSVSLAEDFPFLADPAIKSLYERHYYLWKLSLLMGQRCSDLSLSYDHHFRSDRHAGLQRLAGAGCLDQSQIDGLSGLVVAGETGRWAERHPEPWFREIETRCEGTLDQLGLNAHFGRLPLNEIRKLHAPAWRPYQGAALNGPSKSLLLAYSRQRAEVTRLLYLVRQQENHPS